MNDQIANKVLDMLQVVAAQLGTTVERLYALAVRQTVIEGVRDMIMVIGLGCSAYALVRVSLACWIKHRENQYDYTHDFWSVLTGLGALVAVVSGLVMFTIALPKLLNPEFYAAQFILRAISGLK